MESSHTAELNIPELNAAASNTHVFLGMANHSLRSVGLGNGLQFPESSNPERPTGLGHWPLAYQLETR
jgi:hypothetical protein